MSEPHKKGLGTKNENKHAKNSVPATAGPSRRRQEKRQEREREELGSSDPMPRTTLHYVSAIAFVFYILCGAGMISLLQIGINRDDIFLTKVRLWYITVL